MDAKDIAKLYTDLLHIHKRLPLDAEKRLAEGETMSLISGSAQSWTSKLQLRMISGKLDAQMIINDDLSPKLKEQLTAVKNKLNAAMN